MTYQTQNQFILRHENLSLKFLIRIIWNIKFQGGGKNSIPVFLFEQSDISSIMLWVLFSTHDRCPFWLIHVAVLNAQKSVTCHSRNNRSIGTRTEGNLTCMLIKFFLNFINIYKNLIKKYNWCFAIPRWLQTKV